MRVTRTAVLTPFFWNVAAVVAPTANSAVVRVFPPTVRAFALAGSAGAGVGEAEGVALSDAVGVGLAVGDGEAEGVDAVAEAFGEGVDFATGLAGVFLGGAFFTGFLGLFLAEGFFAAKARSPTKKAEAIPATIAINFLRPALLAGIGCGVSIINR